MLPEEKAREKIDKQLIGAGWDIVSRDEYVPNLSLAVKEALMQDGKECDYLLFVDNKAIAVLEAKKEENPLGLNVAKQAENYAITPESWYGTWFDGLIPLVYLANGKKILFKNMLTDPDGDYQELQEMDSPKKMLKLIKQTSEYGALPRIEKKALRDCQYEAEVNFENSLRKGQKKHLRFLQLVRVKPILPVSQHIDCLIILKPGEYYFLLTEITLLDRQKQNSNCLTEQKISNH